MVNLPLPSLVSLGLDYETLKSINPEFILVHTSAYGNDGPYAERVGFDGIGQAMCGVTYLSGFPDQPIKSAADYTHVLRSKNADEVIRVKAYRPDTRKMLAVRIHVEQPRVNFSGLGGGRRACLVCGSRRGQPPRSHEEQHDKAGQEHGSQSGVHHEIAAWQRH